MMVWLAHIVSGIVEADDLTTREQVLVPASISLGKQGIVRPSAVHDENRACQFRQAVPKIDEDGLALKSTQRLWVLRGHLHRLIDPLGWERLVHRGVVDQNEAAYPRRVSQCGRHGEWDAARPRDGGATLELFGV
jgi:hypothetical protein